MAMAEGGADGGDGGARRREGEAALRASSYATLAEQAIKRGREAVEGGMLKEARKVRVGGLTHGVRGWCAGLKHCVVLRVGCVGGRARWVCGAEPRRARWGALRRGVLCG
eukprot:2635744-Rhodomonas_salina.1